MGVFGNELGKRKRITHSIEINCTKKAHTVLLREASRRGNIYIYNGLYPVKGETERGGDFS